MNDKFGDSEKPEDEFGREFNPKDFQEFLQKFMAGQEGMDPAALAAAAGLPNDPQALAQVIAQLQAAMSASNQNPADEESAGVNWQLATQQAKQIAHASIKPVEAKFRDELKAALSIGTLWLNEVTDISELASEPKLMSRELWVEDAMPLFQALAGPVAERMSQALTDNIKQNAPEELASILASAGGLMKSAGGALFAMQLGQAIGKLSGEVLTGSEIGLPLFQDQRAAFVPQNFDAFVAGLDVEADQAFIYLAVREMAHTRLFKHSKWLRDHVVSQISNYAAGISIDNRKIEELAQDFDGSNPDEIRKALETGALIADRTEDQQLALNRIETMLALVEGWVDVVTEAATKRLPKAAAIAEAVRRRRATGGPAEQTFGTLIGLELRPRRLREAAAMWRAIGEAVGAEQRDRLWDHPDLLPSADDIDNPSALIAKLAGTTNEPDDLDNALRELLGE